MSFSRSFPQLKEHQSHHFMLGASPDTQVWAAGDETQDLIEFEEITSTERPLPATMNRCHVLFRIIRPSGSSALDDILPNPFVLTNMFCSQLLRLPEYERFRPLCVAFGQ